MGWASLLPPVCALPPLLPLALLLLVLAVPPWSAAAMRADRLAQLRQDTVDMFYHGYSNYMRHAFPEDEASATPPPLPVLLSLTQEVPD